MTPFEVFRKRLLESHPGLRPAWEAYLSYWDGDTPGPSFDMIQVAETLPHLLRIGGEEEIAEVFRAIEDQLQNGDEMTKDALATGFLERVIDLIHSDDLDQKLIVSLMGSASKAYCEAWDSFTGSSTPGLLHGVR